MARDLRDDGKIECTMSLATGSCYRITEAGRQWIGAASEADSARLAARNSPA